MSNITVLKKQNTALLVPNALSIRSNLGEKVSLKLVYIIQGLLKVFKVIFLRFGTCLSDKCLENELKSA